MRTWHIWTAFAACLAVVFLALAWVSKAALRLDRNEQLARKQADREETEQLALWRLDSALAPIVAQETAQPYFAYQAFSPAERSYTRMFNEVNPGEILIPSPLLTTEHPFVSLHFQVTPDGKFTSPEVPVGSLRKLAEQNFVSMDKIAQAERRLQEVGGPFECRTVLDKLPPALNVENPPVVMVTAPKVPMQICQTERGVTGIKPIPQQQLERPQAAETAQTFQPNAPQAAPNPAAPIAQAPPNQQEFAPNATTPNPQAQGQSGVPEPQQGLNFTGNGQAQGNLAQQQADVVQDADLIRKNQMDYAQRKMQTAQQYTNRTKGSVEYQRRQEAFQQATNVNKPSFYNDNNGNNFNGKEPQQQREQSRVAESKAPEQKAPEQKVPEQKVPEPQVANITLEQGKEQGTSQAKVPVTPPTGGGGNQEPVQSKIAQSSKQAEPVVQPMQGPIPGVNLFSKESETPGNLTQAVITQPLQPVAHVQVGVFQPVWQGKTLLLARRVKVDQQEYVQACVLEWDTLKENLLERISDLLPNASLEPVVDTSGAWSPQPTSSNPTPAATRMLAFLPVKLLAGDIPDETPLGTTVGVGGLSPIGFSLLLAWICIVLAAAAVAGLLWGVLSLSERRASFVSAVTHELRTPLTTFKLYAEMLEEDMVPNPQTRREYLRTLRSEADRLGHLVENVLDYARLENGRAGGRVEDISTERMLEKFRERLENRAKLAGLKLEVLEDPTKTETSQAELMRGQALERSWKEAASELVDDAPAGRKRAVSAWEALVHVDVGAVERVLFNLVDNAGKYAASAADKRIVLEARMEKQFSDGAGGRVVIRVRDFGPGFSSKELRKLFSPFSKSARQAAESAPGVGLGLALSRRLARGMGGELILRSDVAPGACFELALPMVTTVKS